MKRFLIVFVVAAAGIQLCFGSSAEVTGEEDVQTRIIGGITASEHQYPWSISLQRLLYVSQSTRGHICGGALISFRHAVTSGFCLYEFTTNGLTYVLKNPDEFRVYAGSSQLPIDNAGERRFVANFTPHPSYTGPQSQSYAFDIGVITLTSPFPSSNLTRLAPIAVPTIAPADGTLCTVAGWGSTQNSGNLPSQHLMYTYRNMLPQSVCSQMSLPSGGPFIQPHMMCVQFSSMYTPSCTYDTGNALVCNGALAGVLSWYTPCTNHIYLEVYTRTGSFATWLSTFTSAGHLATPAATLLILASAATMLARLFNSTLL